MLKLETNYDFHELFLNYNICEPSVTGCCILKIMWVSVTGCSIFIEDWGQTDC